LSPITQRGIGIRDRGSEAFWRAGPPGQLRRIGAGGTGERGLEKEGPVSARLQCVFEVGLCRSGESDFGSSTEVAGATRGAAVRAGEAENEDARQGSDGCGPASGGVVVLDVGEARSLPRAARYAKSSFVDARVSATAPWPLRPICECETRPAESRIMPKDHGECMDVTKEHSEDRGRQRDKTRACAQKKGAT
jgi:hypothetical protein